MELDLVFEAPQDSTHRIGARTFRLYERKNLYALPDVFLETEPGVRSQVELQEAVITDVRVSVRDDGQFGSLLKGLWTSSSPAGEWIVARHGVSTGATVQASRLDAAFRAAAGNPIEVTVKWRYTFTGNDRTPRANEVSVVLEFMTPGQQIPPPPQDLISGTRPDKLGVPGPLRDTERRNDFSGFAAVDFGTSSSTVTLYDARHHPDMAIDPGQATRLRLGLADLLFDGPVGSPTLTAAWQRLTAGVAAEVAAYDPDLRGIDSTSLQTRLRTKSELSDGRDLLLDAVCAAVEHVLQRSDEALRVWLAPPLLRVYDQAFNVPPLDEMFLRQVVFDRMSGSREISSTIALEDGNPVRIKLGADAAANDPSKTRRGLKTKLQQPERLPGRATRNGREATTDDLIALTYLALTESAEQYAHDGRNGDPEVIRSLVVTYPTTTPASTREHLETLVRHSLRADEVVTDFDEGVAAGLFFLLRDFGSNRREFGVEGLRARSRRIADNPSTWQLNMLVLDVGAGTTDIVLIGLTLSDVTRRIEGIPEHVQGRFYVIRPELRNSTGHPQLGGDYLTLRVFYWLKAKIVDAMLDGPGLADLRAELRRLVLLDATDPAGSDQSLAAVVVAGGGDEPVPAAVKEKLRAVLPTDWRVQDDVNAQTFEALWRLAEDIKIRLGAANAKPYILSRDDLAEVLSTSPRGNDYVALLPEKGICLESADLLKLMRPVLAQAVQLASWLARQTLGKGEPLDRVMLAGRSSMMPLMRQVVVEELTADDEKQEPLNWNPAALSVEAEYAKQAASIGACWAQSFRNRALGQDDAREDLARGRTQIMIDVDNLTHTLPCAFWLQRQGADHRELLRAGIPLTEMDNAGTVGVRSDWVGLMGDFQVNRPLNNSLSIQWGVFHFRRLAAREGFTPSGIWTLSSDAVVAGKVRAQLEITQTLTPWLHLSQGAPHYLVPEKPTINLGRVFGQRYQQGTEAWLSEIPAAVWVRGQADKENPDGRAVELFPSWLPGPDDDISAWFPEFFRFSADPKLSPMPGRISAPLPPPAANGEYRFFLRWPDEHEDPLGPQRPEGQRGPTARFFATLDPRGCLALHRGNPPYWAASSLEDVQEYAGAVFKVRMEPGVPSFKDSWDPFTGSH